MTLFQDLRLGSTGDAVVALQKALNAAGAASPELAPDGIFGTATDTAVRYYQANYHAGVVGPMVWNSLGLAAPVVTPPPPPPPPPGTFPTTPPLFTLSALDRSTTPNMPAVKAGPNDSGAQVRQEVWNLKPALTKQLTQVWSPSLWRTIINAAAGNTEVMQYPDVSNILTTSSNTPAPYTSFSSILGTWAINMNLHSGTIAEAAYDIWLGTSGSDQYSRELMIWVNNQGQRPAGNDTGQKLTVGGVTYEIWLTSTAKPNPAGSDISLVAPNATSGSTDILGLVKGLVTLGYYPATIGFNMISFGFEVPSTGGVDESFEVTGYTLAVA